MQALFLALVGLAGGGEEAAPGDDWLSLDREIERLAVAPAQTGGPHIGGVFKINYAKSDSFVPATSSNKLGGFVFDNLRLSVEGQAGAFDYLLQYEAASGGNVSGLTTVDAWVRTYVTEHIRATVGNQLRPFLGSSLTEPENLLFILRTADGQFWHSRDQAVKFDGAYENGLAWALSLENGADGAGNEYAYSGRLVYHALGGGVSNVVGALDAGEETRLTVAAGYHDDGNAVGDGGVLALEARASHGRFWMGAEWLDYDDDGGGGSGIYSVFSDTSPYAVAASYMFIQDKYEAAVRYQNLDDANNSEAYTIGVNRYQQGRDAMWQLNFVEVRADSPSMDSTNVALGLTIHI